MFEVDLNSGLKEKPDLKSWCWLTIINARILNMPE